MFVRVYVCVCCCIYVCTYIYVHICMFVNTYVRMFMCAHAPPPPSGPDPAVVGEYDGGGAVDDRRVCVLGHGQLLASE